MQDRAVEPQGDEDTLMGPYFRFQASFRVMTSKSFRVVVVFGKGGTMCSGFSGAYEIVRGQSFGKRYAARCVVIASNFVSLGVGTSLFRSCRLL